VPVLRTSSALMSQVPAPRVHRYATRGPLPAYPVAHPNAQRVATTRGISYDGAREKAPRRPVATWERFTKTRAAMRAFADSAESETEQVR
jgi:hypothetical protein